MTDKNNLEKRDDDICEIMDPHEDVIERMKTHMIDNEKYQELTEFF